MAKIDTIVVHYSATAPEDNVTVATIDKWHKDRGWSGIGYHWVIYRDGSIHKGRDESRTGAHVKNQNTGKIGICWIGGVEASNRNKGVDNRTPEQTASLISLISDLLLRYPGARVVGHRDLAATQCPGFDVIPWWASVESGRPPPRQPDDPGPEPEEPTEKAAESGNPLAVIGALFAGAALYAFRKPIGGLFRMAFREDGTTRAVGIALLVATVAGVAALVVWAL